MNHPPSCSCSLCLPFGSFAGYVDVDPREEALMQERGVGALGALRVGGAAPGPISCPPSITPRALCLPKGSPPPPVFPSRPWLFPVRNGRITSLFGCRNIGTCKKHLGLDIGGDVPGQAGTKIYAPEDGTVVAVGSNPNASTGRHLILSHANGVFSQYMHLLAPNVVNGQRVKRGDFIALMGGTGGVAVHLHWKLYTRRADNGKNGAKVSFDPLYYLRGKFGKHEGLFDDRSGLKYLAAKGITAPVAPTVTAAKVVVPVFLIGGAALTWWALKGKR